MELMDKILSFVKSAFLAGLTLVALGFGFWANGARADFVQKLSQQSSIVATNHVVPAVASASTPQLSGPTNVLTALVAYFGLALLVFFVLAVSAGIYFLPAIISYKRGKRNHGAICVLNLLTGWSFIGWVASLIWACVKDPKAEAIAL
jgi:T4 superinfection immunity protein